MCLCVCVVASTFPATEWSEWRIIHGAPWVPSPHSVLPVLHWPAVAFPSYPLLLLPGPAALRPSYVPLPSSRLPSSQCRHGPKEAGANHWGGVPGLIPVRGEVELTLLSCLTFFQTSGNRKIGTTCIKGILWIGKTKGNIFNCLTQFLTCMYVCSLHNLMYIWGAFATNLSWKDKRDFVVLTLMGFVDVLIAIPCAVLFRE